MERALQCGPCRNQRTSHTPCPVWTGRTELGKGHTLLRQRQMYMVPRFSLAAAGDIFPKTSIVKRRVLHPVPSSELYLPTRLPSSSTTWRVGAVGIFASAKACSVRQSKLHALDRRHRCVNHPVNGDGHAGLELQVLGGGRGAGDMCCGFMLSGPPTACSGGGGQPLQYGIVWSSVYTASGRRERGNVAVRCR